MIRIENLKKEYENKAVLQGINLSVKDGEIVGIIGESGSGKSLLLRCMMLLEEVSSGTVFLDEEEITSPGYDEDKVHKKIGLVFQHFNLFRHLSAVENVMSGMVHINKEDTQTAFEKAKKLLKTVGLADKAFLYPRSLSGGQQQRVAIARTLALDPEIILMDEPTSSLDPIMKGEVESVIRMLAAEGHTMVIATNEMELIHKVCTKVVFIHDGIIWEEGSPEQILNNAEKDETRRFVRALRILEFTVHSAEYDFLGMKTSILDFAHRNGIDIGIANKILSVTEELTQMIIIQPSDENTLKMVFEYNQKEECVDAKVLFTGPEFDPDNPLFFIPWSIMKLRTSEITVGPSDEENYTNKMVMRLR